MMAAPQLASVSEGCDGGLLASLYADPYIARVGHDHRPAAPIDHPQVTYLSAWVAGSFAGAFLVIRGAVDFELHALLKREFLPWSRALGRKCLEWAFAHPINRATVLVIDGLNSARNYCLKLGFKKEGIRRKCCVQGGISKDVHILGMLREEFEA